MPACSVRPLRRGPTTPNTTERAPLPTNPEQCVIYIYPGPHTHTAKPGPLEPSLIPPPHLPAVIRSERTTHGHGSAHTGRRQNAAKQERAPRSHARSSRAKPKNAARKEPPTRMKQRTRTRKKPRREAVSRCVRGATVVFGRTSCRPLHKQRRSHRPGTSKCNAHALEFPAAAAASCVSQAFASARRRHGRRNEGAALIVQVGVLVTRRLRCHSTSTSVPATPSLVAHRRRVLVPRAAEEVLDGLE